MRRMALVVIALLAIALVPAGTSAAPRFGRGQARTRYPRAAAGETRAHAVSAGEEGDPHIRGCDAAPTRPSRGRRAVAVGHGQTQGCDYAEGVHAPGLQGQHRGMGLERRGRDLSASTSLRRLPQRRCAQRHRSGQLPDRSVRHEHVPDRVELVQRRASTDGSNAFLAKLLDLPKGYYNGARGPHRHAHRQRPRRELLRHEQRDITAVHRGVLHVLLRRPHQPVDHVGGFVRLDPPDGGEPAQPSSDPCLNATARPFLYEERSRTSTSTCSRTTWTSTR